MQIELFFAPGTTADCEKLVQQLSPAGMFDAYRFGRHRYNTSDIVLIVNEEAPEKFLVLPRSQYIKRAVRRGASQLGIANQSAHAVMKLPLESDTFWLVLEISEIMRHTGLPVMCVIHAMRHETVDGTSLITN